METWFAIQFADGSTGSMRLLGGWCQGVYRADGTVVSPEEAVEYTCTDMNSAQPSWYVPPAVETPTE
jgi:hypothetical protein